MYNNSTQNNSRSLKEERLLLSINSQQEKKKRRISEQQLKTKKVKGNSKHEVQNITRTERTKEEMKRLTRQKVERK